MSTAVEDNHYSKIDDSAAHCIAQHPSRINEHRDTLSTYLASLIMRNPRQIDYLETNSEQLMTEMFYRICNNPEFRQRVRARVSSDEEFESMMAAFAPGKATAKLTREAAMIINFGTIPSVAETISNCDWTLLLAKRDSQFVLSDVPVFTCDPSSSEISPAGLGNPGNETTLPLTPKMCLLIRPGIHRGYRVRAATDGVIREINRRSAYSAVERFFASRTFPELMTLLKEFPPRPSEHTAFKQGNCFVMPNLVDNAPFSPVWSC